MNQCESVSFSQRVAVAPDVLFRTVGDESVLLNLKTEMYLGLDAIGTRMWTVLQESPSIDAAYDALLQEFEVSPEQLRTDLGELLGKLISYGLLEVGRAFPDDQVGA
jgi:hypothetical protein